MMQLHITAPTNSSQTSRATHRFYHTLRVSCLALVIALAISANCRATIMLTYDLHTGETNGAQTQLKSPVLAFTPTPIDSGLTLDIWIDFLGHQAIKLTENPGFAPFSPSGAEEKIEVVQFFGTPISVGEIVGPITVAYIGLFGDPIRTDTAPFGPKSCISPLNGICQFLDGFGDMTDTTIAFKGIHLSLVNATANSITFDGVQFDAIGTIVEIIVPEPTTLALFATGLAGLGFMMRRRRSTRSLSLSPV